MSTRAFIAIETKDGHEGVYCHFDGYYDHTGSILDNYYNTPEQAKALIDLGHMSSIDKSLAETIFYGRDRGEEDQHKVKFHTKARLLSYAKRSGAEYIYIFNGKDWTNRLV